MTRWPPPPCTCTLVWSLSCWVLLWCEDNRTLQKCQQVTSKLWGKSHCGFYLAPSLGWLTLEEASWGGVKMLLSHVQHFVTLWGVAAPGSTVHGILKARILEWVAIPFSRGSSRPKDQTSLLHCRQPYHLGHQGSPWWDEDSGSSRRGPCTEELGSLTKSLGGFHLRNRSSSPDQAFKGLQPQPTVWPQPRERSRPEPPA